MDKIHLHRCQDLKMWCMNLSPASNPHQEHAVVHELNIHGALLLHSCTHRVFWELLGKGESSHMGRTADSSSEDVS